MTEATLARTVLTVPDMNCDHCVRTITNTLAPLAGVADVAVDLPGKTVQVAYDPALVNLAQISEALAAEDYPVAGSKPAAP